jgi:hypothetical protein
LGFPQSGWKRAFISDRVPHRVRSDGLLDQPTCRRQLAGWLAAFAAARGPDHEARSHKAPAPRRVIAASGTTPSLSCKRRPRSPRGPLLKRGCVVLAVIARTASAASLEPSRRLPVSRLYAESLPYGRVLAGLPTFPTLIRAPLAPRLSRRCYSKRRGLGMSSTSAAPNPSRGRSMKNTSIVMSGSTWAWERNASTLRRVSSSIMSL